LKEEKRNTNELPWSKLRIKLIPWTTKMHIKLVTNDKTHGFLKYKRKTSNANKTRKKMRVQRNFEMPIKFEN